MNDCELQMQSLSFAAQPEAPNAEFAASCCPTYQYEYFLPGQCGLLTAQAGRPAKAPSPVVCGFASASADRRNGANMGRYMLTKRVISTLVLIYNSQATTAQVGNEWEGLLGRKFSEEHEINETNSNIVCRHKSPIKTWANVNKTSVLWNVASDVVGLVDLSDRWNANITTTFSPSKMIGCQHEAERKPLSRH